jgi:deoxyribose-phosphate aldolase
MPSEIDHAAQLARELGAATVCINGRYVERVRKLLEGSPVRRARWWVFRSARWRRR